MSPLASYRRLLDLAGPLYVTLAFVGRLPLAMSQMGTLLLVADTTGRYAAGGLAAGALAVSNAVGSPVAGALADRHGQRPVVLMQSVVGTVGLLALVLVSRQGAGVAAVVAVAAGTGAFLPQVGALARVRWRPLTRRAGDHQGRLVRTAFSYEGAADEASFVLGPALIGLAVAIADPGLALTTAAVLLGVFGTAFALHPSADLVPGHRTRGRVHGRLLTPLLAGLLGAQLLIGVFFGSVQTGNTLIATEAGQPGLAGLVHALLGVGSVLAGLAMAAVPDRVPVSRRTLVAAVGLMLLALPLLVVDSVAAAAAVMVLLGFAVAPYMIGTFTRAEHVVPASGVGTAMTLLAGVTGIGYAVGATVAGRLADLSGAAAAFSVTVAATVLGAALAALLAAVPDPAPPAVAGPRSSPAAGEPSG